MSDRDTAGGGVGTLYIVATPIGNLDDVSARAIETLRQVDLIAAEDTRRTSILLRHYGIRKALTSYHDHNKEARTPKILKTLSNGEDVALVTEAGSPGISDPGYYLVARAASLGRPVVSIPGPCALISAVRRRLL